MIKANNLAVLLLILEAVISPALGADVESIDPDDMELSVARQAMNLIELSQLCDELAAQISIQQGDERELADSLASLSDRLEAVRTVLEDLKTQIESAGKSGITAGLLEDIEVLRSQNSALCDKVQILRKAAHAGPPLAQGGSTETGLLTSALGKAAYALLVVSQEMRGSFLDISSIIGGGVGTLARLGDATAERLPVRPTPGMVVTVFAVLLAFALVSMAIQNYYREAFADSAATRVPGMHTQPRTLMEETPSSTGQQFQDDLAWSEAAPAHAARIPDADEEYAIMLLKLGYKEEALRIVSPRATDPASHRTRVSQGPKQTVGLVVDRTGPHRLAGKTGRSLGPAKRLYKKAFNSLIIAGRRSRRYKMGPIRRTRKKP